MAKVSIQNVSRLYLDNNSEDVAAASDLSLEIADHEFVVLAGPAGCGKSTVLRMIAGLEKISRGDILIGERRVNDVVPKDRDIAMVFRNPALYKHMSAFDNMAYSLKLRKFAKADIKKRVQNAATAVNIEELLERKPPALSRGQCQRVALGGAIARQPKLFLFDEPLSDLGAEMRVLMRAEIKKLHQRLQATMVYVTHDSVEAMTMADRIVVMNNGIVQQTDAPLVLYNQPVNLFVASFLGSPPMNFLHGTLKQERESLLFNELEGGTIQARFSIAERPAAREFLGKPLLLGIRPEDIEVAQVAKAQENSAAKFPALVDMLEPMGAETHLYLQTGAHTVVCRSQSRLSGGEAGHRMQFEMNLEKAHLFDPLSTLRVV